MELSRNKEQISVSKATSTLISLILQMPPREIIETLKYVQRKNELGQNRPAAAFRSEVVFAMGKRVYKGIASTVNTHGMFIETPEPFRAGDSLLLSFEFGNQGRQIKTTGKVANVSHGGIGVEFDSDIDTSLVN